VLTHLHPGVTRAELDDNTGFSLDGEPGVTVAPAAAALALLNTVIDPRGLRFLEALTGAARRTRLRALAAEDAAA
jgi:glutaconate CoA-transferase subunit A/glutaconate CoA-transferase subunit B